MMGSRHRSSGAEPISLDEVDRVILQELQSDGRMSYADLGPKVGLSAPAARQRVQRLIESGVLQVVGVTDPLRLGLPVMAMLGLRVDGDRKALADRIAQEPDIAYLVHTTGTFDLLVEVVCSEPAELLEIVNDRIGALEGVREVETMMYLDIHTHSFNWKIA